MKQSKIFLAALAVVGLASCQQDVGDLGIEQKNPQETVIEGGSAVTVNIAEAIDGKTIDLPYYMSINTVGFMVPVVNVVPSENCPADAELSCVMEMAKDAAYTNAVQVALADNSAEGQTGYQFAASPSELNDAFKALFSQYVVSATPVYVRFAVYADIPTEGLATGTNVRFGGADYWYLSDRQLQVLPVAIPGLMMGTPGADGKDAANSMKLVRNEGNTSIKEYNGLVYITAPFTFEAIGSDLRLGMESEGVASAASTTPITAPSGAGLYYINLKEDGDNWAYSLTRVDAIGCIGDFNGWAGDAALTPNADFTVWTGNVDFAKEGGWKFRMNGGWDINLGGDTMSNLSFNGPNLPIEATGTYKVTLDISSLPYHCTLEAL